MFKVICPVCSLAREVKAKKSWMIGEEPYRHQCKKCCQLDKIKSDDHKMKLSVALKAIQTPDVLERKRQFMLSHPELIKNLRPELGPQAWKGKHHTEESKKLISQRVREVKNESK